MNIRKLIKDLIGYKFVTDSAYTFISFLFLAVSGIISNILVGNYYGASGLGVFNQSLAIYMIASIAGIFGLNTSVIKHISQYSEDFNIQKEVFTTAVILTLFISTALSIIIFFLTVTYKSIFFNEQVTKFTSVIVLSIPALCLNKVFMALMNALRHMKIYALVQSLRWVSIIVYIIISIALHKPVFFIAYGFIITELCLLAFFLVNNFNYFSYIKLRSSFYKNHLDFGGKSVMLGLMSETNNKTDIFFISFFLSNYYVGLYSFAAEIVKGFLNIASVVQLNINPIVSDLWSKNDVNSINKYTSRIVKTMIVIIIPALIIASVLYPVFVRFFMTDNSYLGTIPVFYILIGGILMPSIYYFAGAYLTMAGLLNISLFSLIIAITFNILSCALLTSLFGIYGAAISTSLTYILSVLLMNFFIKKKMSVSLIRFN